MKINKNVLAAALGGAALALSFPAAAQTERSYVGLSAGLAQASERCDVPHISCDNNDQAWKVFAGYHFNRTLAIELGIGNLGETERRSADAAGVAFNSSVESRAIELLGVASLPVGNRFSVYGKLGFYRAETDAVASADTERNADLTFGAGVKLDVQRSFAVRGEWQRYKDVGTTASGKSHVDVLSVGLLLQW